MTILSNTKILLVNFFFKVLSAKTISLVPNQSGRCWRNHLFSLMSKSKCHELKGASDFHTPSLVLRVVSRNFIWMLFQCSVVPSLSYASAFDNSELLSSDLSSISFGSVSLFLSGFLSINSDSVSINSTSFLCCLNCGSYKYKYTYLAFILSLFLAIVLNKFMVKYLISLYIFASRERRLMLQRWIVTSVCVHGITSLKATLK